MNRKISRTVISCVLFSLSGQAMTDDLEYLGISRPQNNIGKSENSDSTEAEKRLRAYYGAQLYKEGLFEDAYSQFSRYLEMDPTEIDMLFLAGKSLGKISRHRDAISYFEKIVSIDEDHAGSLTELGDAYSHLYAESVRNENPEEISLNFKKTIMYYEMSLSKKKDGYPMSRIGATFFYEAARTESIDLMRKSLRALEEAYILRPDIDSTLFNLSLVYSELGDVEKSNLAIFTLQERDMLLAESARKIISDRTDIARPGVIEE